MLGSIWKREDNELLSRKFSKYKICTSLITLLQNKTETIILIVKNMGDEKCMQHGFMSYARNFLFLHLYRVYTKEW